MTDRSNLISAWRRHKSAKGEQSAADILIRFGADVDDPSPHDIPDSKIDAATAALRDGVPAARASTPRTMADLDVSGIWARFNAAGRRRRLKADAEG